MKEYLLSIDIGTSACKVVIFGTNGVVMGSSSKPYKVYYPQAGYVEQNPEEWFEAVCGAIKECFMTSGVEAMDIAGIGVDGQSWSAIALDKSGQVICNTPIWMDTRASKICDRLNQEIGRDNIFELCGNQLQPSYTTPKIIWYQEHMPSEYKRIDKILQSNSYIVYRLTDNITQDVSQGYGLHCFDMHTGAWDKSMCKDFGLSETLFPEIFPCHQVIGTVTKKAAALTGLVEGTPVVAGGLDAACGTLGVGVLSNGQTQEQGGSAGGMSICTKEYLAHESLILSYHVVPGKWLLQGGTVGGGGVMKWFEEQFADYERVMSIELGISSFDQLNEIAGKVPPGSDQLIFLPYMAGERSPIWDVNAKGVYYGLDFAKTKGHMVRAAMEGVAFSLKHNLDTAREAGAIVTELFAMGGAANSYLWTQIKADVTRTKIRVPASDTATALGAAILAGVGVGIYNSFEEAVEKTISVKREHVPDKMNFDLYNTNYQIYLDIYKNLKDTMKQYGR